jgi:CHAT domain-containing protein/tetratricopeptide (TPR) repeat protein
VDLLAELAASIGNDPAQVARQAREIVAEARATDDWRQLSRALAVLGRALRMLGEIDLAEHALDEAITAAGKAGDDELAADAHLAIAGVLSIAGRWPIAFAHLDDVDRLGSTGMREMAEMQRAALCSGAGRIDEALELIARAIPRLRRQKNSLFLARMLANRGRIRVGRGDLASAISDYEEAEVLYRSIGQEFAALQTRHDLGCAFATFGDIPRALHLFDDTSAQFIELGHDASVPLLSRAEALLLGGLSADALSFSQDAARRLQAEGNHSAAAEALVALAEAARLEGNFVVAIDAASRANDWFASRQSAGWERAAELEAMRSRHESVGLGISDVDRLEALAAEMSAAGDARGELYARSIAAVAACEAGQLDRAERQGALAANAARRSRLLQSRLASRHATATVRLERGDRVGACRELSKALDELESTRRLHGAGDAGAAVISQSNSIMRLACKVATSEVRPMRALHWMERARVAGWVSRPALPSTDAAAAADFARLRSVAGELRHAELAGEPTGDLARRQAVLEQSMRAAWLAEASANHEADSLPPLRELNQMVGDSQVVSIASSGDRLIAVVVDRLRATLHSLGDPTRVTTFADRAAGALRGLSVSTSAPAVSAARQQTFLAAIDALDSLLLRPLRLDRGHIVLVVPPDLHRLPWAAMESLRDRSFTISPSVRWWIDAASSRSRAPTSALVVAGPRLAHADEEANGVAACHRRAKLLTAAKATVANVGAAMGRHDVVHLVAHGQFRHDNPLWSTIELADGQLTVYEMERLGRVPPTVVLATCESGVGGARGGAQLHGLAGSLLTMGARTIVASIGALPDTAETRDIMVGLHRDMVSGSTASASLARQRSRTDSGFSLSSASLVTLGVG